jgi:tetratricopeptide (TPR) repeat protein
VAKRYTRKELRKPDEFVTFWQHAYEQLQLSSRPILVGLGMAVLIIGAQAAFSQRSTRNQAEASRLLSRAERMYASELGTDDDPAKKALAQAQGEDDLPKFKTSEERRSATLGELDTLIGKHGGTGAARQGELVRGGVLYDAGRYDEAIKAYGDFLAREGTDNRLRFLAREGRGYAYEAKGDLQAALDEFKKLERESEVYKDRAQFHQARILEKKGDAKAATDLYKSILEKSPTSAMRDEISNRLAALEAR